MNALSAVSTTHRRPTFAAIIFHADEAPLLRACIQHHLAIGIDRLLVSLNGDDAQSAAVAESFASERVRVTRIEEFAPDPSDYFDAGMRAVVAWAHPDWVMCIDSDEFWVPSSGSIAGVAGLGDADAYSVRRFNAPPVRERDGTIRWFDPHDPGGALLVGIRHTMDAEFLANNAAISWINARIGPKLMVRPSVVARMAFGAHQFEPGDGTPRTVVPDDVLIVHLPFTDEARFRRKIDGVRMMLARHEHRLQPGEAWHWRRWVEVAAGDGLAAEYAAQVIDADAVAALRSGGALTTPAELFATRRLVDA